MRLHTVAEKTGIVMGKAIIVMEKTIRELMSKDTKLGRHIYMSNHYCYHWLIGRVPDT